MLLHDTRGRDFYGDNMEHLSGKKPGISEKRGFFFFFVFFLYIITQKTDTWSSQGGTCDFDLAPGLFGHW